MLFLPMSKLVREGISLKQVKAEEVKVNRHYQ
jgi:hypothetical protein